MAEKVTEPELDALIQRLAELSGIKAQALRYLEAVYGKSVWFRAPETFDNLVERWMYTICGGGKAATAYGDEIMTEIENQVKAARKGGTK